MKHFIKLSVLFIMITVMLTITAYAEEAPEFDFSIEAFDGDGNSIGEFTQEDRHLIWMTVYGNDNIYFVANMDEGVEIEIDGVKLEKGIPSSTVELEISDINEGPSNFFQCKIKKGETIKKSYLYVYCYPEDYVNISVFERSDDKNYGRNLITYEQYKNSQDTNTIVCDIKSGKQLFNGAFVRNVETDIREGFKVNFGVTANPDYTEVLIDDKKVETRNFSDEVELKEGINNFHIEVIANGVSKEYDYQVIVPGDEIVVEDEIVDSGKKLSVFYNPLMNHANESYAVSFETDEGVAVTDNTNKKSVIASLEDGAVYRFYADVKYSVKAEDGYKIKAVYLDGKPIYTAGGKISIKQIRGNHTIKIITEKVVNLSDIAD